MQQEASVSPDDNCGSYTTSSAQYGQGDSVHDVLETKGSGLSQNIPSFPIAGTQATLGMLLFAFSFGALLAVVVLVFTSRAIPAPAWITTYLNQQRS